NALCSALLDHTLDAAGRARLNTLLAGSEEARRFYVRSMALSASLHDYAGELQSDEPERVVRVPGWRWVTGSLAAAAAVLLAFWMMERQGTTSRLAAAGDDDAFVATISATNGSQWKGRGPALGEELPQGRQLDLVSGFAEVTFNSGAQVVLEGPALLDLTSAWEAVLQRGTLRANVPPEAVGFRISNPDVEVTDLGTEFSMVTGEQGGTEVFVLKGSVEASAEGRAQPITLREQQARRFDRARISEVRDREQKLKRWAVKSKLAQFTRPAGYAHWSFDEAGGAAMHAELIGLARTGALETAVVPPEMKRVEGHRGRALVCDGEILASTEVPAATKAGTTIAFWVRVPEDAALTEAGPMIALGGGRFTTVSWNRDPTVGALGALRTDTERGRIIGTASLRDGRWHHIAVVLSPGGRTRQYFDGRLETATAKHFKVPHNERRARAGAAAEKASAMLNIGGSPARDGRASESFRGTIDELFLADRALTPPEIRQLLRENKPAPPVTIADTAL
ncbi:MAG: LamG-like jellyroll fold domain-containing protein, partial [Chthoniobacteraceae bacterium]